MFVLEVTFVPRISLNFIHQAWLIRICVVDGYLSLVTFLNRFVFISAIIYFVVQLNFTVSLCRGYVCDYN